jgi:hypothetical protein
MHREKIIEVTHGKFAFDEKGMIILPEWIKKAREKEKLRKKIVQTFKKKLIFYYNGTEIEDLVKCEFEIELPKVRGVRERILKIKAWTDRNVKIKKTARICLEKSGDGYLLTIRGRGNDERCTWRRSFRTALSTNLFDLKVAVCQKDCCKFDKQEYRKIKIFYVDQNAGIHRKIIS